MGARVGLGYDSHRFDTGGRLILAGIFFPDSPGLKAHSDGDAVAHAVTDAILGAAALGDIGSHFPPSQAEWRDADSMDLLSRAVDVLAAAGWVPSNIDVTVVCERPRIGPKALEMRSSLANVLGLVPEAVSIKGKTNEGMGWIGRGEGIAVHAVAMIEPDKG
ncbi:MAG: 2-C-methyl-D-erythritol 2,4-cyclodiphosphate synthase [Gemmatimonadetes bacterium]|nr:2-C-methyl-D-erythritol 2,4-cyclodiphosphate synthase [Gemmatimonadota bacterium]